MPSIGEATRSDGGRRRRRLVVGLGLVVAGALFVGLGAAGAASGEPSTTGLAVGGVTVVASLALFATRLRLRSHERALLAVGTVIAAASSLFVWTLTPAAVLARPLLTAVGGLGYLAGLAVMVAALVAGVTLRGGERSAGVTGSRVSWTRSTRRRAGRTQVADGGTADDELVAPLDDE